MNRVLIFLVAILLGVSAASAQKSDYGDVRRFEGELGVGFATAGKAGGIKVTPGMALFLEGRYNIDNTPFDVGLQILFTNYARDGVMIDGERYDMHIMPRPFIVYGDYNFRRWKRVSFFGGLGLGYAQVVNQSRWSNGNRMSNYELRITSL